MSSKVTKVTTVTKEVVQSPYKGAKPPVKTLSNKQLEFFARGMYRLRQQKQKR